MAKAIGRQAYEVDIFSTKAASQAIYTRILAKEANLQESWFRDAIFDNPEIVIGVCREAGLVDEGESWYAWAREFNLDAGSVDVLLLSSRGRIGIVETKLSFNPERRREVVAQICDYALALQEKPYEDLPNKPTVVETELPNENDIRESMAIGNFLLIIAGDEIDPRALRLGTAILAGHLTSKWDLAMVDMNLFVDTSVTPPRHLMIPELRGQLIAETRQVVRVIVQGETPKAKVMVERIPPPPIDKPVLWDENHFFDALGSIPVSSEFSTADAVQIAKNILSGLHIRKLVVRWGTGKTIGSFGPVITGFSSRIFTVYANGRIDIHFQDIMKTLFKDEREKGRELLNRFNQIPTVQIPEEAIDKYPTIQFSALKNEADLKTFFDTIDWLIR